MCWRWLGNKTSTQRSTQMDHVQIEESVSKSMVASYKDKEAQMDRTLHKHKGVQAASRT